MFEKLRSAKAFVKAHAEELVVAVLATVALGTAYGLNRSAKKDIEELDASED